MIPKIFDDCGTTSNIALRCLLLSVSCVLEKQSRGSKSQTSSFTAIINKHSGWCRCEKPKKVLEQKVLKGRLRSICTKLHEGNVKAGIRMAEGVDKISDFTADNNAALQRKHPRYRSRKVCVGT